MRPRSTQAPAEAPARTDWPPPASSSAGMELFTVPEVARTLRVTVRHVWALIRDGRFKPVNVGRGRRKVYRVTTEELERFVRGGEEAPAAAPKRRVLPPVPRLI